MLAGDGLPAIPVERNRRIAAPAPPEKNSGQALHGTGRTSLPLLPSGPGGVHAPAHAWHLAAANHAPLTRWSKPYFLFRDAVCAPPALTR